MECLSKNASNAFYWIRRVIEMLSNCHGLTDERAYALSGVVKRTTTNTYESTEKYSSGWFSKLEFLFVVSHCLDNPKVKRTPTQRNTVAMKVSKTTQHSVNFYSYNSLCIFLWYLMLYFCCVFYCFLHRF